MEPEKDSFDLEEEEYIQFLQQYGHIDFTMLNY